MRDPRYVFAAVALALVATACSGEHASNGAGTAPPATGAVAVGAAAEAVLGLCEIAADHADDHATAEAVFHDRSHETLHTIAAAVEEVDRAVAADLLTAKQRVEADLASNALPAGFARDVDALLSATTQALEAIGVAVPPCPA